MSRSLAVRTLSSLVIATGVFASSLLAQSAGQDVQNAGTDTKHAAQDTGHAASTTTKKAYHKTKHTTKAATKDTKSGASKAVDSTKEGTTKVADKTKELSVKGYDKSKEGVEKVVAPKAAKKAAVEDKAKEAQMTTKDTAMQDKQKVQDAKPQ